MRARFLILPSLLALAACSKPDDSLRVLHNLTAHSASKEEVALENAVAQSRCLNIPNLIKYISEHSQNEVTVYVRNLELDKGWDGKYVPLDDSKTASDKVLKGAAPLIESFPSNRIGDSQILKDYMPVGMIQSDCNSAIIGDLDYKPINYKEAPQATIVRRAGTGVNNQNVPVASTKSSTRWTLELESINGNKFITYHESGGVLTITAHSKNTGLVDTCKDKAQQTTTTTEIVVVHGRRFDQAGLKKSFYNLMLASLDPKAVDADQTDLAKETDQNKAPKIDTRAKFDILQTGRVYLDYSQLASLSGAIGAGLFQSLQCTK